MTAPSAGRTQAGSAGRPRTRARARAARAELRSRAAAGRGRAGAEEDMPARSAIRARALREATGSPLGSGPGRTSRAERSGPGQEVAHAGVAHLAHELVPSHAALG